MSKKETKKYAKDKQLLETKKKLEKLDKKEGKVMRKANKKLEKYSVKRAKLAVLIEDIENDMVCDEHLSEDEKAQ